METNLCSVGLWLLSVNVARWSISMKDQDVDCAVFPCVLTSLPLSWCVSLSVVTMATITTAHTSEVVYWVWTENLFSLMSQFEGVSLWLVKSFCSLVFLLHDHLLSSSSLFHRFFLFVYLSYFWGATWKCFSLLTPEPSPSLLSLSRWHFLSIRNMATVFSTFQRSQNVLELVLFFPLRSSLLFFCIQ